MDFLLYLLIGYGLCGYCLFYWSHQPAKPGEAFVPDDDTLVPVHVRPKKVGHRGE
ncbi:MAG TPA: hypothetical protein VGM54_05480 [Chthoniobacter sp.]